MSAEAKAYRESAYFLGPKSENASWFRSEFQAVLDQWFDWRRSLFGEDPSPIPDAVRLQPEFLAEREIIAQKVRELGDLMTGEVPKYTPRYIGHMVSELSIPAMLGHFVTLLHNPNNTSRDVARVSGVVEDEAIAMLAAMIGFNPDLAQGHFTSGGTLANFESIWRARYRMDHFLALGLCMAERTGERFEPVAAAHMGWARFHELSALNDFSDAEMRQFRAGQPLCYRREDRPGVRGKLGRPGFAGTGQQAFFLAESRQCFWPGRRGLLVCGAGCPRPAEHSSLASRY